MAHERELELIALINIQQFNYLINNEEERSIETSEAR